MIERYAFRMAGRRLVEPLTILIVAGIVLVLDQLSKRAVIEHHGEKILIPGWLAIAPQLNPHGAFGLFGSNTTLLIAMAVLVLVIFWLSFRDAARRSLVVRIAFGMIIGGAIGNIVDRIRYGYVIDFVDFNRFPTIWRYTFNVADACITTGVILLILASLAASRRRA